MINEYLPRLKPSGNPYNFEEKIVKHKVIIEYEDRYNLKTESHIIITMTHYIVVSNKHNYAIDTFIHEDEIEDGWGFEENRL